jgi:hypothetical protein
VSQFCIKGKGKVYPITRHEGSKEGEYSYSVFKIAKRDY